MLFILIPQFAMANTTSSIDTLMKNRLVTDKNYKYNLANYIKMVKNNKSLHTSGGVGLYGLSPAAGVGYSSDTQSVAPAICFNPSSITKTGQISEIKFDSGVDIASLEKEFSLAASVNMSGGLFSGDAMAQYFSSLEENNYSLSVNYYQKISSWVETRYPYVAKTLLTQDGADIYADGENPLFRLYCGDSLVNKYEEGAALILSMDIVFKDRLQKEEFKSKIGASLFGNLATATATISNYARQYNLSGQIIIKGKQLGGDPSQLGKILDPNISSCDLKNATSCQKAVEGFIKYANTEFPNQFKKDNNGIWTSPLIPLGKIEKGQKLSAFLKLSPSYVTPEVEAARKELLNQYRKNQYYQENIDKLLLNYPVPLDVNFKTTAQNTLNQTKANLATLDNAGEYRAADCWTEAYMCEEVATYINARLKNVDFDSYRMADLIHAPSTNTDWAGDFWPDTSIVNGLVEYIAYSSEDERARSRYYIISGKAYASPSMPVTQYFSMPLESGRYYDVGCSQEDWFDININAQTNTYQFRLKNHYSPHCRSNATWNENIHFTFKKNPYYIPQYVNHIK